jgi:hypothetical protein
MNKIDVDFDFRKDSKCGDPDTDSQKLYGAHKFLWNKMLPCGKFLDLKIIGDTYGRLLIKNNLCDNLSSDRMCPHFDGNIMASLTGGCLILRKKLVEVQKVCYSELRHCGVCRNLLHWSGIVAYFDNGINGILEGINSKIQVAKRRARGYRNPQNFINMIYLIAGKLKLEYQLYPLKTT